ncbi:SRPBCC domain-containing protein [Nocardioides sp.]|uniref:SRPBCC domain-containing protein n=1 Tax=Nocardioides sp. TaxID=35761 RepID=UPI0035272D25
MTEAMIETAPPVVRATWVRCAPTRAFEAFTDQIGAWWPLPTHGIYGDRAGGAAFEGGRLVERSVAGEESVWGSVLAWEPPDRLVVSWHPGGEPDQASEVEVTFAAEGDGTRVVLEHRGWERFGDSAMLKRRRYVGPGAWGAVLEHFADVAEDRVDPAVDLGALRSAYDAFFAEAARGGFGEPEPGEWDAAQVLAHVALNDLAMTAIAHALVHRRTDLRLGNLVCQDREVMAAEIDRAGSLEALIGMGRRAADVAIAAVSRLDEDQLDALVHCTLHHDGEVVLDQPMPWVQIAVHLQASRHLPAHVEQLAKLRG